MDKDGSLKSKETEMSKYEIALAVKDAQEFGNPRKKEGDMQAIIPFGGRVILFPGVVIGENVVIGGGSLVTRNVPAGEIWFGSPAIKKGEVPKGEWL